MAKVVMLKTASVAEIAKRNNRELEKKLIPKGYPKHKLSKGIVSLINFINDRREPITVEISKVAKPFKIDSNWNCDVPLESLNNQY